DAAGAVDPVEHREDEGPDLRGTAGTDDVDDLRGQVFGREDARTARVLEVVAHIRDAVGPRDDLTLSGCRRRAPPRVVAHTVERLHTEVERLEGDVGAVDGVVVAPGQVGSERGF